MAATVSAPPPSSPPRVEAPDTEDSNISSPLTEVDDKDDNEEDIEHMQIDNDDEGTPKPSVVSKKAVSDSDSVLSDAHSDIHSDGNDTEAETERLYDTPRHQRQRDVVVDQFNEGQIFEHTPSKLRRTANFNHEDHRDDESLSGDEASIISARATDDSPTKVVASKDTSVDDANRNDPQERKRKRSPALDPDPSEPEQPLKKRTSSGHETESSNTKPVEDVVMHEDEPTPANEVSGTQTPAEDAESSPRKKIIAHEDDVTTERTTRATKKNTRGSRRKTHAVTENDRETEDGSHEDAQDGGTDVGHNTESAEADADEETEAVTAHDEEMERKHAAFRDWTHIEEMFGIFRDRLYKDRLQRLEEEEKSLLAPNPTHPEYLNMKQCLDDRLEQKLREINKELEYRIRAHENRSVAQRAQIWGQYFQAVREKRERTLEALNQEWYDVQTARRSAHSLENVGLLFPKDPAQRVRNAIAYNTEVSTLSSIAKYEGFPAVPEMKGASQVELEDDMAAIHQSRRERQKQAVQPRDEYHTTPFDRLGPAGEQFLRETPWANPNHHAHKMHSTPNPAAEPHAETPNGRATQLGAVGPNPKKQASSVLSTRLSESPELTRSMLNPSHHQMKRVSGIPGVNHGSKTATA
ncbi:Sds3-like-domain-containing protein [Mariannaea sp. PMI_226]|nr:Sds3-like-domain-containing protein [Mariannaea sp. PMI_226]